MVAITNEIFKMKLNENLNMDRLNFVKENFNIICEKYKINDNANKEFLTKEKLIKLYNNKIKSKITYYNYNKDLHFGRCFASSDYSTQLMKSQIRNYLFADNHLNLDIKNCHPVIIYNICNKYNIPCDTIKNYVLNREEIITELIAEYNISYADAKKSILTIINDCECKISIPDNNFLIDLRCEIKNITEKFKKMSSNLNDLLEEVNKERLERDKINKKISFLSYFLFHQEEELMRIIIGYLQNNNISISLYLFDGLFIEKKNISNIDSLIISIQDEIKKNYDWMDIKLSIKSIECIDFHLDEFITNKGLINFKDNEWIDNLDYDLHKNIIIKAGLGTGKTTSYIDYINRTDYDKIILIGARRTFDKAITNRLNEDIKGFKINFIHYKDKNFYLDTQQFVVIQYESLHKLQVKDIQYVKSLKSLLILDEIESILTCTTSSETNSSNLKNNFNVFEFLLKNVSKTISLDAFISYRTINFYNSILNHNYLYNIYTKQLKQRKYININNLDLEETNIKTILKDNEFTKYVYFIHNKLKNNEKIFCVSTSKSKANSLYDYLTKDNKEEFKNKKIKLYTADDNTLLNDKMEVDKIWCDYDIIITTMTITVGINYTLKTFNCIAVYISSLSQNLIRDVIQCTYRIRHLKDDVLYYTVNKKTLNKNYDLSYYNIRKTLKITSNAKTSDYKLIKNDESNFIRDYQHLNNNEVFIDLLAENILERNISIRKPEETFINYLKECNYIEQLIDDTDFNLDEMNFTDEKIDYETIESMSTDEYNNLKFCVKSKYQKLRCEKFEFNKIQKINGMNKLKKGELNKIFIHYRKNKEIYKNIYLEKNYLMNTQDLKEKINCENYLTNDLSKLKLIIIACNKLGLNNSCNGEITQTKINDSMDYFECNYENYYSLFDLRKSQSKNKFNEDALIEMLKGVFENWSNHELICTSKKLQINKIRKTIKSYTLSNIKKSFKDIDIFENTFTTFIFSYIPEIVNCDLNNTNNEELGFKFEVNNYICKFQNDFSKIKYLTMTSQEQKEFKKINKIKEISIINKNIDKVKYDEINEIYIFLNKDEKKLYNTLNRNEQKQYRIDNFINGLL